MGTRATGEPNVTACSAAAELDAVSRRFGSLTALDAVTLSVEAGSIVGILGHNGAGKTTLLEILSTLLLPSSGRALVMGHDVVASPARARSVLRVLDPHARDQTHRAIVDHARHRGATILWSTHDLHEAESVCDRVIVLHKGRVTLDQSVEVLRQTPGSLQRAYGTATADTGA